MHVFQIIFKIHLYPCLCYAEHDGVTYEEVSEPHTIETGDSVKVKQVLDEVTIAVIEDSGCVADWSWDNYKLLMMFLACLFALRAQFCPVPFPESRLILALFCGMYFFMSSALQYIISYIDMDNIMYLKPCEGKFEDMVIISTSFPKYQEWFYLTMRYNGTGKGGGDSKKEAVAKMYVGKYFTSKGEFEEETYRKDVKHCLDSFIAKKFIEQEYNHKMD